MPKLFRIGEYVIFFWSNENDEPIHIHINPVHAEPNSTKVWLTRQGGCIVANNKSRISKSDLNELLKLIQNNYFVICDRWKNYFKTDTIKFYC